MNPHFSTLISNRNSVVEAKGAVYDGTRSLTTSLSCQGAAVVVAGDTRMPAWLHHSAIPNREKVVRIVIAFQLLLYVKEML